MEGWAERWAELAADERCEAFLAQLRERLQVQSRVPPLPAGWHSESAMVAARGFEYGGDFFVAELTSGPGFGRLQMVLVDACGHGPSAVPEALQFAGALGALVRAVPEEDVLDHANHYVQTRVQPSGFATAVQVGIDLLSGAYRIRSAGHPPVLHWSSAERAWVVDTARGTALGVVQRTDASVAEGVVLPGEALMFYTDGVVEARGHDIDEGIDSLRATDMSGGYAGLAAAILDGLPRGEDDRAVMLLWRD